MLDMLLLASQNHTNT